MIKVSRIQEKRVIKMPSGEDVPKLLTTGQLDILNLSSTFPRSLLKVSAGYLEISQPGYLKAPA
jgi:hypothetical protein